MLMLVNFTYNFRDYGIKSIDNKAEILAKTVEHALTTQMQTGVISRRELFLEQLVDLPNINEIWLSRGQKVIDVYGTGHNNETPRDEIDEEVLRTGLTKKIMDENVFTNSTYRITIPYKATSQGPINCMQCHYNAHEGDTLGAISIVIPVDESKKSGINMIFHTTFISLVLIFIIGFLINKLVSPFLVVFDSIKKVMSKAQEGDYSHRVVDVKNKDAKDVTKWVNTLLEKLENTLGNIDSRISIFLTNEKSIEKDPLINVKNTVDRLANVYKFRKTIEHDETLEDIYNRLASVLKYDLKIDNFNLVEADTITGELNNVYVSKKIYCDTKNFKCRADQTNTIVDSTKEFQDVCKACQTNEMNYVCIPHSISNELDLIVAIYTDTKKEAEDIRKNIPYINDFIDATKTVIISKKLMNILEKNARTDPLTNLYNRKHLEEQVPKITSQANRTGTTFGVLMLDIDHFKMVNDTYGHDVGDIAIKIVAQTLEENTRTSDIIIRFGGEEFIVLLHNCEEEYVYEVSEKIRKAFLNKEIDTGKDTIKKTVSIGASIFPKSNKDLNTCIKYADIALYEAKNSGRNKVVMFRPELLEKESKV